jgi:hypothetical protein
MRHGAVDIPLERHGWPPLEYLPMANDQHESTSPGVDGPSGNLPADGRDRHSASTLVSVGERTREIGLRRSLGRGAAIFSPRRCWRRSPSASSVGSLARVRGPAVRWPSISALAYIRGQDGYGRSRHRLPLRLPPASASPTVVKSRDGAWFSQEFACPPIGRCGRVWQHGRPC